MSGILLAVKQFTWYSSIQLAVHKYEQFTVSSRNSSHGTAVYSWQCTSMNRILLAVGTKQTVQKYERLLLAVHKYEQYTTSNIINSTSTQYTASSTQR